MLACDGSISLTIGAKYMVVMDGKGIVAKDNLNVNAHSF